MRNSALYRKRANREGTRGSKTLRAGFDPIEGLLFEFFEIIHKLNGFSSIHWNLTPPRYFEVYILPLSLVSFISNQR